jgi:superfamily II DNA helicase RecQ
MIIFLDTKHAVDRLTQDLLNSGVRAAALHGGIVTAQRTRRLLHRREVFAWTQRIRRKDADNAVYKEPDQWLSDLYKAQSRRAKRPTAPKTWKRSPRPAT